MIILNLNRLMLQKGIARPVGHLRKFGINYEMAKKIMRGQQKSIKLATIEKICLLMNCTPNDCME